jgi:hypothetical protein
MRAERLADDIESRGERGVAEGLIGLARVEARMVAVSDFSGLVSSACALASAPIVSLDLEEGGAGRAEQAGDFGPGIGLAHIDDPHRLDSRLRRFDAERSRRFGGFNAAPELSLGGDLEMLIERIGRNGDLDPFAAPSDDGQHC